MSSTQSRIDELEAIAYEPNGEGVLPLDENVAREILEAGEVAFARVGEAAVGRGAVVGDWLGITAMITVPPARCRGHGRAILHALARWGAARGCAHAMLQVERGNEAAFALYGGAGFVAHHDYPYRMLR